MRRWCESGLDVYMHERAKPTNFHQHRIKRAKVKLFSEHWFSKDFWSLLYIQIFTIELRIASKFVIGPKSQRKPSVVRTDSTSCRWSASGHRFERVVFRNSKTTETSTSSRSGLHVTEVYWIIRRMPSDSVGVLSVVGHKLCFKF